VPGPTKGYQQRPAPQTGEAEPAKKQNTKQFERKGIRRKGNVGPAVGANAIPYTMSSYRGWCHRTSAMMPRDSNTPPKIKMT
jgi:hypothetical protein